MLALFLGSPSARAYALADPITVLSQTYTISFPQAIDFQITVHDSSSTITQGRIYITSDTPRYFSESHIVIPGHPAASVTLDWHEDTSSSSFFPPGSHITYYWQIQDTRGSFAQAPQQFSTVDTRFSWQHLSQGLLQVNWYNHPTSFGQIIVSQATTSLSRISNNIGGGLLHPINLWVYQTSDDFRGSLPPNTHEWVGGIAFPSLDEAFIVADSPADNTLIRDMPHELTHLVFHQRIAQGISAPVWFDEGLAVYNQLYQEPEMTLRLKEALNTHTLLPLKTLYFEFPANADQAYLAYAQSWNLVDYMYNTFGLNDMHALVQDMNSTQHNFTEDVQQALGVAVLHLENQWRISLRQPVIQGIDTGSLASQPAQKSIPRPGLTDSNTPLLLSLGILLIVLPLSGIIALFIYQRRNRIRARLIAPSGPYPSNVGTFHAGGAQAHNWDRTPYSSPQQLGYTPPGTPAVWGPGYPAPPFNERQTRAGQERSSMPYVPGQEYVNQPPIKQAPQE
jgi:hypothetical protein